MDNIYILNQDFTLEGIIDNYVSVIWRPSYSDIGDFELYLGATNKSVNLLQINRYAVRSSDISVGSDGKVTYKKVMIIKNIDIITDVENGNFITVTGRELKYILHQRIVWSQTNLSGTAENAIRTLVTNNAVNPTNTRRVIPNLVLGSSAGLTDTIEKQVTGSYLDATVVEICNSYYYGWEIYIYDNKMTLSLYTGLDRSYNQTDGPYVVFSDNFENLCNTEYQVFCEEYANCTLIGGEGEGVDRTYTTVNNTKSGLNRFETFTDARDLSSNKGSEDEIPQADYLKLLQERGKENLASLAYTEGFTGEVLSNVAFKYGVDFDLGDVVTVINEYGISKNVRVMSAIESEDATGAKLLPQFNL